MAAPLHSRSERFCAPGRIRTCDARFRKPRFEPREEAGEVGVTSQAPTPEPCSYLAQRFAVRPRGAITDGRSLQSMSLAGLAAPAAASRPASSDHDRTDRRLRAPLACRRGRCYVRGRSWLARSSSRRFRPTCQPCNSQSRPLTVGDRRPNVQVRIPATYSFNDSRVASVAFRCAATGR
jgi:hypothetical protein